MKIGLNSYIMPRSEEAQKEYDKKYYQNHKEERNEYQNKYNEEHKDDPEYIKKFRIRNWKRKGVICEDFDSLYEHYLSVN